MEQIKDIDERVVMFFTHDEVVRRKEALLKPHANGGDVQKTKQCLPTTFFL